MTLVSVTAYHSFGGEVEVLNTPTIRRLTPSCRHQLPRIALLRSLRVIVAAPSITTIKKLFALSGNRCAFPDCTEKMIDQSDILIGEVCHICGDKPRSKRYDPAQTDAERQGFSNLILLCPKHHIMIDDNETTFLVSVIKQMKKRHEDNATEPYIISNSMAERIILFLGGSIAGAALAEFAQGLGQMVGTLANISGTTKPNKKTEQEEAHEEALRRAAEILRYAPKGSFTCLAERSIPDGVTRFFARLFTASGWREINKDDPRKGIASSLDDSSFAMAFFLDDPHQVSNAKQAIDEVFREFGFEPVRNGDTEELFGREHGFRVFLIVAARR